ncbi:hypothetical protein HELRODRAFT_167269 [Helobdella robusta]|uniref:Methyltransferase domain-containing protein n=1 Tax=Helobdella robusta TaxID=6412 RepID=T1EZ73_HELRO|nr:hypothetical protein HELRODRAFT_167269 [Helobdella robusta]ESO10771.1 hypothetical protein HELRODRAFT_167269 [Helobdella robusta]
MATQKISYPETLKALRKCFSEREILLELMKNLSAGSSELKEVRTCLSIGTGYGGYDLDFIRICLPNLENLIVVEKDEDCLRELKINLDNQFKEKFDVIIMKCSMESFMEMFEKKDYDKLIDVLEENNSEKNFDEILKLFEKKIDIVLTMHVLYFLDPAQRMKLYRMCFDQWMNSALGRFVTVNVSGDDNATNRLLRELQLKEFVNSETVKEELEGEEVSVLDELSFECPMQMTDINNLYEAMKFCIESLQMTDFVEKIKMIAPDGWACHKGSLCVCAKIDGGALQI